MTELDKKWISEASPLGPPADPGNNTPISGKALEDLEQRIRNEIADPAALPSSVALDSDVAAVQADLDARTFITEPVGIARLSLGTGLGADTYRLYRRLRGEMYASVDLLQPPSLPGGENLVNQLQAAQIVMPWLSVDSEDESVVRSGESWTSKTSQSLAYGGSYRYATTAGDKATWTTPDNVTRIGCRPPVVSNAGMVKVVIDGDATLANLLPTAEELVENGRLKELGSLEASDRILDLYSLASSPLATVDYDRHFAIADGLEAGEHTVELVTLEEKNVASSANRNYIGGFTYATAETGRTTEGAELLEYARLLSEYFSASEYAHKLRYEAEESFIGSIHGYEKQGGLTVYVDGVEQSLEAGDEVFGGIVEVVRETTLQHPKSGEEDVANVVTIYRLSADSERDLEVLHRTEWLKTGELTLDYPLMLPLDGPIFRRGALDSEATEYDLTEDEGGTHGLAEQEKARMWDNRSPSGLQGKALASLTILNNETTTDGWAQSNPAYLYIEDRTPTNVNAGNLSKIYVTRVGSEGEPVSVENGTIQAARGRYRLDWLPNADVEARA